MPPGLDSLAVTSAGRGPVPHRDRSRVLWMQRGSHFDLTVGWFGGQFPAKGQKWGLQNAQKGLLPGDLRRGLL